MKTKNPPLSKPKEILFFPRKVVKMMNAAVNHILDDHFLVIDERTSQRAMGLVTATPETYEGLTSGLRSAIILNNQGRYIRLKGIAERVASTKQHRYTGWGTCSLYEAWGEQESALEVLKTEGREVVAVTPKYTWSFHEVEKTAKVIRFDFVKPMSSPKNKIEISAMKKALNENERAGAIPAYEITGDTRIDEAFYELTKQKLRGAKLYERDELMRELSFQSGRSLAQFNLAGFAWYPGTATNSHLGNFVVDFDKTSIKIKLADLLSVNQIWKPEDEFNNRGTIPLKDVETDMLTFEQDFQAEYTTSPPTCLRYRHFPDYLRQNCFNEFVEGYVSVRVPKISLPKITHKRKPRQISEKELRQRINYIMEE